MSNTQNQPSNSKPVNAQNPAPARNPEKAADDNSDNRKKDSE